MDEWENQLPEMTIITSNGLDIVEAEFDFGYMFNAGKE